tara:strand:+ start:1137 stop:2144 length:1008 start_codon:yes stop_codon:yes gene_type:complete
METLSKPVAPYLLKPLTKNKEKISFCEFRMIPLKLLVGAKVNRSKVEKHIKLMIKKIRDNGFLDAIKVFEKSITDDDKIYQSAEGAYRIEALQRIFGHNSNVEIPCMVLPPDVYNVDDIEQTLETIVGLNKDNRAWTLEDYVKSWSKSGRRDYHTLFNLIQRYGKPPTDRNLSVAQVCYIFVGGRTAPKIKQLKAGNFKLQKDYEKICNHLLDTLETWVKEWSNNTKDGLHKTYSTHLFGKIASVVTEQLPIVQNQKHLWDWMDLLLVKYYRILETHFVNQANKPLAKRKPLEGLSTKMDEDWEHNFEKFVKENPVPKPKSDPIGFDKFTKKAVA